MSRPIVRNLCVCVSLLFFNFAVYAQGESLENQAAIDLSEALERTMAKNPDLSVFGYQIEAAEGVLQQAGLAPNPELAVEVEDVLGTDDFSGVERAQTTVTLGWVLERSRRQRRIDAANANVSLNTVDVEIMRLDVAAQTARLFVICLAYQGRLINGGEAVSQAQETVEAVRVRVAASRALEADLARAEAELARAELVEEDYEHELLSAYHRLAAQWGQTQPDFNSVRGDLSTLPVAEAFETLLASVEKNPELARFMSQQRLDETELELVQERAKPSWRVYTGLRRIGFTDDIVLVGGISVPLAVRNRNQGQISEARANLARTEAETTAARVRVKTSLYVLYQEFLHSLHLAERLSNDVVPRLERALTDTQRAYELGRYSYLEWSVVQAELLEANNDLLEASVDAHQIIIEIERLTGERFTLPTPNQ
ncbi:MAG: TolC family protein [Proteobacteria bacterium]|jgi:outer membrane protein, heavy metal efflux system|nr:TolC family protein [Pseudomonadota bacterium]